MSFVNIKISNLFYKKFLYCLMTLTKFYCDIISYSGVALGMSNKRESIFRPL
jgi:hypothetical protein